MMAASQSPSPSTLEVPRAIRQSPLMRLGGFGVYAGLIDGVTFGHLYAEGAAAYPRASAQESWDADAEEIRGGTPRRKLLTGEGGAVQDAMYASPMLLQILSAQCGVPVVPSGNRGSYSYYARPGDFLDLHRDVETCDVAMITCLYDNSDPRDPSGGLVLYPGRIGEPLSAIRLRPDEGACLAKLEPGHTIVLFGGVLPHRVVPVAAGQLRMISVLCFRALLQD